MPEAKKLHEPASWKPMLTLPAIPRQPTDAKTTAKRKQSTDPTEVNIILPEFYCESCKDQATAKTVIAQSRLASFANSLSANLGHPELDASRATLSWLPLEREAPCKYDPARKGGRK
jgi:hypothetical protein